MMNFLKNNKYLIIILLVVLAAGFGGYKYYANKKAASATPVKTATVEKGNIRSSISATGALSAVDNVDVNSKITGRIVEVYVAENQHVVKGQPLMRLDDTTLMATQKQMEARLIESTATYNRYATLLSQGAISKSVFDTAEADYKVAKAQYDSSVSNTNDTLIVSPIDGYIIGKPTPVGQTVSSGISTPQVLMSVANLDNMQIELMVDESDIGQVKEGQKVEFTVDSYTDETFTGKVRLISKSATTTNNVIYYTVYVNVDNPGGKLLPKMTARANIIISEALDTLMVPITCLRTNDKQKFVQVYDEKTKQSKNVNVEVGLTGDDNIQVKSGDIKVGDKLLVKEIKATQTNRMGGPPGF